MSTTPSTRYRSTKTARISHASAGHPRRRKRTSGDAAGTLYFEQIWFPGVHADIGGGYEENDSRLSDNALAWMLAAASIAPNGLKHDETVLRLYPDPAGPQHNEQKNSWLAFGLRNCRAPRPSCINLFIADLQRVPLFSLIRRVSTSRQT